MALHLLLEGLHSLSEAYTYCRKLILTVEILPLIIESLYLLSKSLYLLLKTLYLLSRASRDIIFIYPYFFESNRIKFEIRQFDRSSSELAGFVSKEPL
jgi:hypothetical protein